MEEDPTVNRMVESLNLFEKIVNNEYFQAKSFIIFFNKIDLFEEKIKKKSIKEIFPHYSGDDDSYTQSTEFVMQEYLAQDKNDMPGKRSLYPYLTMATDTQLVKRIFLAVSDIILQAFLGEILIN